MLFKPGIQSEVSSPLAYVYCYRAFITTMLNGKAFLVLLIILIGGIFYFGYSVGSELPKKTKKIIIPKTEIIIKNGKSDTTYIYKF